MDPLTVIGLFSNIIGFVDLGVKLFNTTKEIYDSASGTPDSAASYEFIAEKMQEFTNRLIPPGETVSDKDRAICDLAKKCRSLAQDIRTLFAKTKPRDPKSRGQSFISAIKMAKYKKRREELQSRLATCQQQLEMHLNYATSSKIQRDLNALITSSKDDSNLILQLQKRVEDLHQNVNNAFSARGQVQLGGLLQVSEGSYNTFLSKYLLSDLRFDSRDTRFGDVAEPHDDTFQWIFDDDLNATHMLLHRNQFHQSFNSWLSSGDGIFHISGKLGSGKSTLMKLLYHDYRTQERLMEWAGDRELIKAQFFFWKPGSKLQKSMEGLLRALLYECLMSVPELVAETLPKQWSEIKSTPLQMHRKVQFPLDDLQTAFDRLVDRGVEGYRICFFIDGLDEYDAPLHDDYLAMVERLCRWSQLSEGEIKFCVSSREHNVFMNHFPDSQRICMQDLTRPDMERFIRDKFELTEQQKKLEPLVELISEKANGVFLWVALVIRRLRDLNEREEATLKRLKKEIDDIPEQLEDLFKHLLQSIHRSDRKRAYRTFAVLQKLNEEDLPYVHFPLAAYCFIDDCLADQPDETIPTLHELDEMSKNEKLTRGRKMLMGSCMGLVEPTRIISLIDDDFQEWGVSFTHRSVPEFLQSVHSQDWEEHLKGFCPEGAISWLLLIYLRDKNTMWYKKSGYEQPSCISHYIMDIRQKANISREPFFLEDQLEATLVRHGCADIREEDDYGKLHIASLKDAAFYFIGTLNPQSDRVFRICNPLYLAAFVGNTAYVIWKTTQDPSCIQNPLTIPILLYCHYYSFMRGRTTDSIHGVNLPLHHLTTPTSLSPCVHPRLSISDKGAKLSVWQHLVLGLVAGFQMLPEETAAEDIFWERFLETRADTYLAISSTSKRKWGKHPVKLIVGKERRQVDLSIDLNTRGIGHLLGLFDRGGVCEITLAQIFDQCGIPNRDKLISLVEHNNRLSSEESARAERDGSTQPISRDDTPRDNSQSVNQLSTYNRASKNKN
ncbi:hypothetical protein ASPWEDRAFT_171353 [Aspergillus wentii DTO 134E9]|uniref:Nephrocystin 3-like N-terminal domain-containing protein n=1 Tax=Aspergillus wentii DTO 134E9 TaxID=1073089 RepID=A0A1L9RSK5_ASPWE|nr:uncharacterized protein ASPWEDRAFT_171353 [Aspergillus wentii DTO 134E9]KAI9930729.1 hypothetical protein MW887_011486 [Aspergillus wentii]OJJ37899.1 hypothetical protein ASPWEDRAFT_171353 [Aspergillus wentii DTO 134E9]